ncbi:MAG: phosphate ABC transporter permease subunit PstC [Acetanaerobacterium sp.]
MVGGKKTRRAIAKNIVESIMNVIFFVCGITAIIAVAGITVYMVVAGAPSIAKIGILEFLFGSVWNPIAAEPKFGILYMILTSLSGTLLAILIGVPIALFTAIFLAELAPKPLYKIVSPAVELLAGIPSVIYGIVGAMLLVPAIRQLEKVFFLDDPNHVFTGGSNLISAVLVLAVMILPTIINVSETAIKAVPREYKEASLAMGASHIQTIFRVTLGAARSGIVTSIVLGVGRAIGEAMAIIMVAGNVVNLPLPFNSVRFLTTAIVSDMSYAAQGLHRQSLFGIGLVLFVFIMIINIILNVVLKGRESR